MVTLNEGRPANSLQRVSVIMTCYNRSSVTLRCLELLFEQVGAGREFALIVILVDDSSPDGTAELVKNRWGDRVVVLNGTGDLFWAGGMAFAHGFAARENPDYILWLNDDVELEQSAVADLLVACRDAGGDAIVAGWLRDPSSNELTYGGYCSKGRKPGSLRLVSPASHLLEIDAFNGNVVMVPRAVYHAVGGPDGAFAHAYGDWDYGYRVAQQGFKSYLSAASVGRCARNSDEGAWWNAALPRNARLSLLFGRKGLPFLSHYRFMRRHGGVLWPVYFCSSYAKALIRIVVAR